MSLPSTIVSPLVFLISLLLLQSHPGTVATPVHGSPPSKPIVIPITKDSSTSLYTIPVKNGGAPLVLDLAGNLIWSTCQQGHRTIPCKSSVCKVANRKRQASCSPANGGQPGSTDPHCACTAYPYNPVSGQCGNGDLTVVPLSANATDGEHPLFPVSIKAYEACAQDGLKESLPTGATGVAGLSRLPLSLPSQIASRLKVAKEFTLCLPGGDQPGAAIFGGGPFQLMGAWPTPPNFADELRQNSLPLLKNPKNGAYYFRLHGIAVNQEQVPIEKGAMDLNFGSGRGGAAFSTVTPYTSLRADIFSAVVSAFDKATGGIPRRQAQWPFLICYEASAFSYTFLGPAVADIDLMLDNDRNWTFPGGNSLVKVDEHTLCLAFLSINSEVGFPNSKAIPESPAVILGAYQMENNVVHFDLEKGMFGFSGLLDGRRTQCGNFNFNS